MAATIAAAMTAAVCTAAEPQATADAGGNAGNVGNGGEAGTTGNVGNGGEAAKPQAASGSAEGRGEKGNWERYVPEELNF